ncbi:hypothetical protein [Streptomyces specialis]|uniref:hypothetical protein n=1 Tax=Streptomyces specialis TaxID=498367 RepID=UPI000A90E949|nr:hypothetical protein [Streptomyces specialis]
MSKVFERDGVQLRVDHGVFELFRRSGVIGSYRTPLSWVKVRAEAREGGVTRLHFGHVEQLDEPLYASTTSSRHLLATVEIPTADEPLYRAFFAELASLSGRPIAS